MEVSVPHSASSALAFLDELATLHKVSWNARGKDGVFDSKLFLNFHSTLIANTFDKGTIKLFKLMVDGVAIAVLYSFVHDGKVLFYQSGFASYDDNRMKPGLVAHVLAINEYMKEGLAEYDFLAGEARYKKTLSNDCRELHWVTVFSRSMKMYAINALIQGKRLYERSIKNAPQ